ncbi:MAG: porin family protein [Alistipes sp.]|nr:porin family protein [Rikenellaceae bacterium]MBQ8470466.1 porin family protein [Alistipes sp.]
MKRLIPFVSLLMALVVTQQSVAQSDYMQVRTERKSPIRWGLIAGVNMADFELKGTKFELENKLGWQVGMMASIPLGSIMTLDPQLIYVHQTLDLSNPNFKETGELTCSSIDLPLGLGFKVAGPLRLFFGPVFTLMNESDGSFGKEELDYSGLRTTFSYMLGAEVRLFDHLRVDVRYNGQFKNKDNVMLPDNAGGVGEVRTQCFFLNVGYYF